MAETRNSQVPAIVLGFDTTGLGTLRSLHLAGIPSYVACKPGDLVTRSRWYRPTPGPEPWDGTLGERGMAILRTMPLEGAVLIPGADDAALWLTDLPASDLGSRFRTSTSSRRTLEILLDKAQFKEYLASAGVPHPRTFSVASASDIDAIPFEELDRVFIKPTNSQKFNQIVGTKGIWVQSRAEFRELWDRLDAAGFKVMAQEYVPGAASDHYFVDGFRDRNGTFTGLFARRRLRIYPPDFGNSSYCESIPLGEVDGAVRCLVDLLSRLEYRGIFSAEFKRDARNGEFKILEVNTRAWWYVEFAARCGVNVCRMAYEDACGEPVTPSTRDYPIGAGCVYLIGDMKTVFMHGARSEPLWKIVMQWIRGHGFVFNFRDPMPGLYVMWSLVRNGFGRTRTKLRRDHKPLKAE
jgi:D-aspartate ligase